jgi:hypothetical protein
MQRDLTVSSWVGIRKGCPMRYRVNGSDGVEFAFGGVRDCFEFVFEAETLRQFLNLGGQALRELDARQAKEGDAKDQEQDTHESVVNGERCHD